VGLLRDETMPNQARVIKVLATLLTSMTIGAIILMALGQILTTEKWQRQWSPIPGPTWYGSSQTIRICVIADGKTTLLTDCQIKRIETLLDGLCRKFRIQPEAIYYPNDWL